MDERDALLLAESLDEGPEAVRVAIQSGALTERTPDPRDGSTFLHLAAARDASGGLVTEMLAAGWDPECEVDGVLPAHVAASFGNLAALDALLAAGTHLYATRPGGLTVYYNLHTSALDEAEVAAELRRVALGLEKDWIAVALTADSGSISRCEWSGAADAQDAHLVLSEVLGRMSGGLQENKEPRHPDGEWLSVAVQLLDSRVDPAGPDGRGDALSQAVRLGRHDLVQRMLLAGAPVNDMAWKAALFSGLTTGGPDPGIVRALRLKGGPPSPTVLMDIEISGVSLPGAVRDLISR